MLTRKLIVITAALIGCTPVVATAADVGDQVSYSSRPDGLAVFLNDIAYARDSVSLPGGVDIRVLLPASVFAETLVLRENGDRVADYRVRRGAEQTAVEWQSASQGVLREVTLEYLLGGVGWSPTYDMWIASDTEETVDLDAFAEIRNGALSMEDVETQLIAGRVDTAQVIADPAAVSMNQVLAGYEDAGVGSAGVPTGPVRIQHVYDVGAVSAEPGDVVYLAMEQATLPARRLHLWNAPSDDRVTVIYKVRNETDEPLADGVVRSYEDGLFIGSDLIELTPVGSEGSVTVGQLQDVRVERSETTTEVDQDAYEYLHEVVLTISNFGTEPIDLEVVDVWQPEAEAFTFSAEPAKESGNVLRWEVTVEPGEEEVIKYSFRVD
jgi:hypothetical protein